MNNASCQHLVADASVNANSTSLVANPADVSSLQTLPPTLSFRVKGKVETGAKQPPFLLEHRERFLTEFEKHRVLVLQGETGSGKTCLVPRFVFESQQKNIRKKIYCVQPRILPAKNSATYVSKEMGENKPLRVGYAVRLENNITSQTRIIYCTAGVFQSILTSSPQHEIEDISCVIVDEIHEQDIKTEIILGLLKEKLKVHNGLKLVLMSATMDPSIYVRFFLPVVVGYLRIPGRNFRVDIVYHLPQNYDIVDASIKTIMEIVVFEPPGNILCFLTGEAEITAAINTLGERVKDCKEIMPVVINRLYSKLDDEQKFRALSTELPESNNRLVGRRVIFATPIAETSLTIDGIVFVIDCGKRKQKYFNPNTKTNELIVEDISKAAADQRAGRCGRTQPGKCIRLYTPEMYESFQPTTLPEISRSDLTDVALTLKTYGVEDILNFGFVHQPTEQALQAAVNELVQLGALDDKEDITKLGKLMTKFPLPPSLAKAVISSFKYNCQEEILTLSAMLQSAVCDLFETDVNRDKLGDYIHPDSDFITLINLYDEFSGRIPDSRDWTPDRLRAWCRKEHVVFRQLDNCFRARQQLQRKFDKNLSAITQLNTQQPTRGTVRRVTEAEAYQNIHAALSHGFPMNLARFEDGKFVTASGLVVDSMRLSLCDKDSLQENDFLLFYSLVHSISKNSSRESLGFSAVGKISQELKQILVTEGVLKNLAPTPVNNNVVIIDDDQDMTNDDDKGEVPVNNNVIIIDDDHQDLTNNNKGEHTPTLSLTSPKTSTTTLSYIDSTNIRYWACGNDVAVDERFWDNLEGLKNFLPDNAQDLSKFLKCFIKKLVKQNIPKQFCDKLFYWPFLFAQVIPFELKMQWTRVLLYQKQDLQHITKWTSKKLEEEIDSFIYGLRGAWDTYENQNLDTDSAMLDDTAMDGTTQNAKKVNFNFDFNAHEHVEIHDWLMQGTIQPAPTSAPASASESSATILQPQTPLNPLSPAALLSESAVSKDNVEAEVEKEKEEQIEKKSSSSLSSTSLPPPTIIKQLLENGQCFSCGEVGHTQSKCPKGTLEERILDRVCWNCYDPGHHIKDCPTLVCELCGENHLRNHCPRRIRQEPPPKKTPEQKKAQSTLLQRRRRENNRKQRDSEAINNAENDDYPNKRQKTEHKCFKCKNEFPRNMFTKNQMKKPSGTRICINCKPLQ